MRNVISLFTPDVLERFKRARTPLSNKERENAAHLGWYRHFCENCGRPYTRPPTFYSVTEMYEHPLWPDWQLTRNCSKGHCDGVYLIRGFKPRLVKGHALKS